jgi:hypothetical protein
MSGDQTNAITVLQLAKARGVVTSDEGTINMAEFRRVGLAMIGGCARCEATIGAFNAYPSRLGFWLCGECLQGGEGFASAAEFEAWTPDVEFDDSYGGPDDTDEW